MEMRMGREQESVHEMFEEQAEKTPEAVAVVWRGEEMRYGELNRRANQLATLFKEEGSEGRRCESGSVWSERMEMVVAMLGVLKAGGAYVPLDREVSGGAAGVHVGRCGGACW